MYDKKVHDEFPINVKLTEMINRRNQKLAKKAMKKAAKNDKKNKGR